MFKEEFPLLAGNSLTYLDSAATTQKPEAVLQRLDRFYGKENANVHRALYPLGDGATASYEESRTRVKHFLNAPSSREIVFTSGTTGSLNFLADSFGETLSRGDHILLSEMEHHSNLVPWQMAAKRYGLILDFIPVNEKGRLDLSGMRRNWHEKTKLVSVTHISNLLGTVNPLEEIIDFAHGKGVPVAVDAAQSVSRLPIDVQELDCDFLAFSGHKIYGPTGIGVLYGKEHLLERLSPRFGGGSMISSVSLEESTWAELPQRFEAGTPPIAEAVGLGEALNWLESRGRAGISQHESLLTAYGIEKLRSLEGIELYGTGEEDQLGVISFNMGGLHAHDTVQFLSAGDLALRAGHHCAQPLIRKLGVPSTVRASFAVYNDTSDIDRLAEVLAETMNYFRKKGVL
ncbi:MAG: cysteine desulfurase [Spirochaetales bacterium]|nr:cysteine desulfurase [Spirochaetales bacterium]